MASVVHDDLYPSLKNYFSPTEQKRLVGEDLTAGRRVAGLLVSVITAGMVAGIIAVLAIAMC